MGCHFVRLGLVPNGHRFGVLMGRVSVKRLSSIVSEVQTTIAFQLHLQVVASLFCGMGPKEPAERLRQSLYTVRRIRRLAVGRRESRTPKLRTEGQAPAVLKCLGQDQIAQLHCIRENLDRNGHPIATIDFVQPFAIQWVRIYLPNAYA